ncbi:MAG: chloride channel protein, partial [Candidatus Dormibacteraeota bacterium]|nr:chloride channel protein [Candidatus Dormibacteraeota bacterium]
VYNVPLGGALFIAEVLWGGISIPVLLPALTCCAIATAVGWLYLPHQPTYLAVPNYALSPQQLGWALLAGPLIGLVAVGFVRLIGWVSAHHASGRWVLVAPLGAFLILGAFSLAYPQLLGNGRGMAHQAFLGEATFGLLVALFVLKPLVTALCLGSGASGGLFTPTISVGAVLGGALGQVWSLLWPGTPPGAYALLGAAAMLGAATQAPLTAVVMILELTDSGIRLAVPMAVATVLATLVGRLLDGYSIYSARLAAHPRALETPPPPI